jgi:3-isopropylmalate/(R)-2-methylmalate dehydratase small subunit
MKPFTVLRALAAPLAVNNVETDQIIPARQCVRPAGAGYGDALFSPWRYHADGAEIPEFILNREPYRAAEILVVGSNFGYGSSREHAAWAVRDFGLRAIIASSFPSIFAANCVRNGVLPATLSADAVAALHAELAQTPQELTIDLPSQTVATGSGAMYRFDLAPLDKQLLLAGSDAIDLILTLEHEIDAFQTADRVRRPWVYEPLRAESKRPA